MIINMIQFSSTWPCCFEDDNAVIRHEFGHALVWLTCGYEVHSLRFVRGNRLLTATTRYTESNCQTEAELLLTMPDILTERLLAGEIASRIYCELPLNIICSSLSVNPDSDLTSLLQGQLPSNYDDVKAFEIARQTAGQNWYHWLAERHKNALNTITNYWDALDNASDVLYGDIPVGANDSFSIHGGQIRGLLGL